MAETVEGSGLVPGWTTTLLIGAATRALANTAPVRTLSARLGSTAYFNAAAVSPLATACRKPVTASSAVAPAGVGGSLAVALAVGVGCG